jgi:hypothetical protein
VGEAQRQMAAFGAQELSSIVWALAVLQLRPSRAWLRDFESQVRWWWQGFSLQWCCRGFACSGSALVRCCVSLGCDVALSCIFKMVGVSSVKAALLLRAAGLPLHQLACSEHYNNQQACVHAAPYHLALYASLLSLCRR